MKAALEKIARRLGGNKVVKVGFLSGATYPASKPKKLRAQYAKKKAKADGTKAPVSGAQGGTTVAMVAAIQNFGSGNIPPRPFFTNMIHDKSPEWPGAIANLLKANDYDADKTLNQVGLAIKGQLQKSIIDTNSPPLAQSTIDRKGFDKPLIDTSHMINSVDYEVD